MFEPLSLRNHQPVIAGSRRLVYQHPNDPDLLVKILIHEEGRPVPLFGLRRPNEMVRSFRREIGEFLRVRAKFAEGPLPIARVYGVVETDLGTGLLVERIAAPDGDLAFTLKEHVQKHGFSAALERLVLGLRDELVGLGIVAGDINTNNVVVGMTEAGGERLVVVDGLGDNTFVPVKSLSPVLNRLSHERRFARIVDRLRELGSER